MNIKKTLLCSGLLFLTPAHEVMATDKATDGAAVKKAAAITVAASTTRTSHLQPPATPRPQLTPAAMPPATPASAAAGTTASTHRSSPTTATSQSAQANAKEEYEAALVYNQKTHQYEPQVRKKSITVIPAKPHHRNLQSDAHGMSPDEIFKMVAAAQHRQSQQNTPRPSPTPKKSSCLWLLCCSSSDEVEPYSAH
jgi:hypothetical protein